MADTLSFQSMRSANAARESEELRIETRKKNLLILVLQYLTEEGYVESARTLEQETNVNLNRYEVCDNVNLETVLMDYESYYHVKFNRYPKITKKQITGDELNGRGGKGAKSGSRSFSNTNGSSLPQLNVSNTSSVATSASSHKSSSSANATVNVRRTSANRKPASIPRKASSTSGLTDGAVSGGDDLTGLIVFNGGQSAGSTHNVAATSNGSTQQSHKTPGKGGGKQIIDIRAMISNATKLPNMDDNPDDRILKPLGGFSGYSAEWRELAQVISNDIYLQNPNVRWDDIIGLESAKRLVKEAVVYPIRYPQLFTGILSPWKGLLLYGPPGTGKTLLAKAVATECKTTFFNISASSIVSKWRGDSEKLVRVLFELARFHAPSTIFLDELESVMSQRGGQAGGGEHEGSRRMKTELLVQMDGLAKSDDLVFLLAASNLPWELDHAMLRRLEKRILVGLPTCEARCAMFRNLLPSVVCSPQSNGFELTADVDYEILAKKTDGYSGSDIRLVCKEAAMRPVRKIFAILDNHEDGQDLDIRLSPITTADVETALSSTKPSAKNLVGQYAAWQKEYESV